jgi:hypothetical protein
MLWLSFNVKTYQAKITTPGLVFHPETTKYASFNTNVKIGVIDDSILSVISTALITMVLKHSPSSVEGVMFSSYPNIARMSLLPARY